MLDDELINHHTICIVDVQRGWILQLPLFRQFPPLHRNGNDVRNNRHLSSLHDD